MSWPGAVKLTYKVLRSILVTLLILTVALPALLYVTLSLPPVQRRLCGIARQELTALFGVPIEIESLSISPFSRVDISGVLIRDERSDTIMHARHLGAGISMSRLLFHGEPVITYVELVGLKARINRPMPGSPLNIQPIIDALKPKDKNKPPTRFDLQINTIVIRQSQLAYDVLSAPATPGHFNPAHIHIDDLKADISIPKLSNDDFDIELKRLSATEHSGLTITRLQTNATVTENGIDLRNTELRMPESTIRFSDIDIKFDGWQDIAPSILHQPHHVAILPGSHVTLADLGALVPQLRNFNRQVDIELAATGSADSIALEHFDLSLPDEKAWIMCQGHIRGLDSIRTASLHLSRLSVNATGKEITDIAGSFTQLSPMAVRTICNLGQICLNGSIDAANDNVNFNGSLSTTPGAFDLRANARRLSATGSRISGQIRSARLGIGSILNNNDLGTAGIDITFDATMGRRHRNGTIDCTLGHIEWKGHRYADISSAFTFDDTRYTGTLTIEDSAIDLIAEGEIVIDEDTPRFDFHAGLGHVDFATLGVWDKYPDHTLSATIDAHFSGNTIDTADGSLVVSDIRFTDSISSGIILKQIAVDAINSTPEQHIDIAGDFISGRVEGSYDFATIVPAAREILAEVFPALMTKPEIQQPKSRHKSRPTKKERPARSNNFTYHLTIRDNEPFCKFLNAPVRVIYPIDIDGTFSHDASIMGLSVDIPYIQQKDKLIRNTAIRFSVDGIRDRAALLATTLMPTKKGDLTLQIGFDGASDRVDTDIAWHIDRKSAFYGKLNMSSLFTRDEQDHTLNSSVTVNPSELVFNDTVWQVEKADISVAGNKINVSGFNIHRPGQRLTIGGTASAAPADTIKLSLVDINLDYIFETLDIPNVMFGGDATGDFYASSLLTKAPSLSTPGLSVKGLSYNRSLMGDTRILSTWDNDTRAVTIDAVVDQANGCKSIIEGAIFPMADSLDFRFHADKIGVGFMKPFMEAFASDVSGYASGDARLWGNFKYIDMTGDLYADDFNVRLAFTNTTYSATDSVHLKPGLIDIHDITLRDQYGNTALLNGRLTHQCFKQPVFEFAITHADNLLSYDVGQNTSDPWYGRIFANGSAFVSGKPGEVNINVMMSTAPRSTFTFVLSDAEQASEYSFITFRDRDELAISDSITYSIGSPELARLLQRKINTSASEDASAYRMNIQMDVTPDAQMNLVMDPVGGDRIRAYGSGTIRMQYDSSNEDLKMFGTYTLTKGNYNFTLQDIIIKEFTISDGSRIAFHGDPYSAQLDIKAIYSLNANLSDLDESFLSDKELNRTNVPVHAVLKVAGDMRQPDISFDLEFPTLTQDTYRKVRSIVSTEDMMNRQIIYLLALNRFYTPDYMASTTKGNELVSVASSTISSQLSSMLGALSDHWSVAPTVRSDRGDFSDVEVDLALSSTLLNNRLLLNGNLGYRDKSLNNNSFIGDFDIEYLLNRSGNLRLKAYNRYNDQNYYVKTALTTQGIGIVLKRDFDNILSFLRPFWKRKKTQPEIPTPTDTTGTVPVTMESSDSIPAAESGY